jgi:hypothetical protein
VLIGTFTQCLKTFQVCITASAREHYSSNLARGTSEVACGCSTLTVSPEWRGRQNTKRRLET